MYIKLNKFHLLGIVILSLVLGGLGLLGVKETYENLQNPRHVHKDYLCSVVPKKIPRDVQLRHYAATNDISETRKRQRFGRNKSNVELAATTSDMDEPDFLTKTELDCGGKLARITGGESYNAYQKNIKLYESIMTDRTVKKSDKLKYVQMMRKELQEKGCYPPIGGESESSINSTKTGAGASGVSEPDYQCLRISDKVTHAHSVNDPINEERVGFTSPENHYRRGYHKHMKDKVVREEAKLNTHIRRDLHRGQHFHKRDIPKGQEDLYILKSQIVPPVCPKCPEMPSLTNICSKCGKNKKESEVEDDLEKNEIKPKPSRAARRREIRRRTNSNSPGIAEAANRNKPNQTAFAPQAGVPIPRLNSFSAFG